MDSMTKKIFASLLLCFIIILFLFIYSINEPQRIITAVEKFRQKTVERGRIVFEEHCIVCHGDDGLGIEAWTSPLNSKEYLESIDDSGLRRAIAYGLPDMPPFSREMNGPLKDNEIDDIVTFIRNWELKSLSAEKKISEINEANEPENGTKPTIILLSGDVSGYDIDKGAALYAQECVFCHGLNGEERTNNITLNSNEYLSGRENTVMFNAIATGIPDQMPSYGKDGDSPLSDEEIWNIIAFIRSWEK